MTREEIVAVLMRRAEAWARLDAAALALDYADDATVESPLAVGPTHGRGAITHLFEVYFVAFPDLEMQQHDVLVDGNRAVVVATFLGTDRGGFMGLAPTGRRVSIPVVFLYEFEAGLITRDRRVYDFTSVLLQVGALKAKPR